MPEQLSRERLHTIIRMVVSARGPKVADEIADHIIALEAENAEWKASFDLYNKAIRRGDDAWRQAHPDMDCYPDTGEMVKWLCDRNDALEAENERLRAVAEAARHAFNMRPAHYATYRLSYDVVEQPGLYWHASGLAPAMDTLGCALATLEGEATDFEGPQA